VITKRRFYSLKILQNEKNPALMILFSTFNLAAVYGQNPIPSWNIPVYHRANFQETSKKISGQGDQLMEKRVLNGHGTLYPL
jgi:hypothetical protein